VLVPANLTEQVWRIDPEYYWFEACDCISGYQESNDAREEAVWANAWLEANANYTPVDMTILTCELKPRFGPQQVALLTVINGAFLIALVLVSYCFCCRRVSKPVRAIQAIRKRAVGMPKVGRMSVVVTDIEGYSGGCWGCGWVWVGLGGLGGW